MNLSKSNNKIYINCKLFAINILEIINKVIIFLIILSNEKFLKKLNFDSQITITIKGTGIQQILSYYYNGNNPDKILINGINQSTIDKYVYDLNNEINNITMIWNYQLTTCYFMFYQLDNIISFDFSKFDTSKVTDMSWMFASCSSFTTLDLSNFNTSLVKTFYYMFYNCHSLISLNINNFNLKSSKTISYMFENCFSLISLDLYNFDTSTIIYFTDIFKNINKNIIIRYNETKVSNILDILSNFKNNSSDICFTNKNHKLIKELSKCVNTCEEESGYKYEYKNICYNKCPEGTNILNESKCIDYIPDDYLNSTTINKCDIKCKTCSYESIINNNLCTSCNIEKKYYPKFNINSNNSDNYINCYQNLEEEGYYLDNNTYKSCYFSCQKCNQTGNKENNQCLTCKYNYTNYKFENKFNCYNECQHYYYFDEFNNFICTINNTCPQGFKLIREKNKCIDNCTNDNIYKNELNNICYKNLPNSEFNLLYFFYNNTISNYTPELVDKTISNIKNQIMNGELNYILEDVILRQGNDLVRNEGNIIYQITSLENQNNNEYTNISTINLGECEKILKDVYHINQSKTLFIFKYDYFQQDSLIPIINYEFYHPDNKSILDLSYCENTSINLNIPVTINENKIYKYDPNNEYYTDECSPSTTDKGTDILINDRQNEYNNNNMSICENNCLFIEYDSKNKKSICNCKIKPKQSSVSNLAENTDILSYNFEKKNQSANAMKCYKTLFSQEGLIKNIGSYILIFTTFLFAISGILFYKCGYQLLEDDINLIKQLKEKENSSKNINIKNTEPIKYKNKTKIKKLKKKTKIKIDPIKKFGNKTIKKKNNYVNANNNINKSVYQNQTFSKRELKNNENNKYLKKINNCEKCENEKSCANPLKYCDYEKNTFSYKNAKKYDKRSFISFYISLIRAKHYLIFSFFPIKDYNSRIIKICLFFLSYSIYYFISALFISESTIHKIYNDGKYNFIYLLPQIMYSFIISHTL